MVNLVSHSVETSDRGSFMVSISLLASDLMPIFIDQDTKPDTAQATYSNIENLLPEAIFRVFGIHHNCREPKSV